jgi:hypothetical protein
MRFCQVCGLSHLDDSPLCDPTEYRYGKIITEAEGGLRYEPPGGISECRSFNANDAENEGRLPLTRAIPIVAHHACCTADRWTETYSAWKTTASGAAITRLTGITAGSTSASTSAIAKERKKRTAELGGLFSRRIKTKNPTLESEKPSRVEYQNSVS